MNNEIEKQAEAKATQTVIAQSLNDCMAGKPANRVFNLLHDLGGSAFQPNLDGSEAFSLFSPIGWVALQAWLNPLWAQLKFLDKVSNGQKAPNIKGLITPKRQKALDVREQSIKRIETEIDRLTDGTLYVLSHLVEHASDPMQFYVSVAEAYIESKEDTNPKATVELDETEMISAEIPEEIAKQLHGVHASAGFIDEVNSLLADNYTVREIREQLDAMVVQNNAFAQNERASAFGFGGDFINLFMDDAPEEFAFTEEDDRRMMASVGTIKNIIRKKVLKNRIRKPEPWYASNDRTNKRITEVMASAIEQFDAQMNREETEAEASPDYPEMGSEEELPPTSYGSGTVLTPEMLAEARAKADRTTVSG